MTAGRGAAYALLGLAGLLVLAAAASAWSGVSRLSARGDDAASAEEAAAAFVRAYAEFDYRRAELYAPRLAGLAAGGLKSALASASVDPAAVAGRLSGTAAVESARVTSLAGDAAVVAVRSRQERTRVDGESGEVVSEAVTQHASLRLVRSGTRWLVAELELVSEEPAGAAGARRGTGG